MTIYQMRRGMEIFAKYAGDDYSLDGAEHDLIFGPPKREMDLSDEDWNELIALGWYEGDYGWEHNV